MSKDKIAELAKVMDMPVTSKSVRDGWEWEITISPDGIRRERRLGRATEKPADDVVTFNFDELVGSIVDADASWRDVLGGRESDED